MGYPADKPAASSGAVAIVVIGVIILVFCGIFVVGIGALFFFRSVGTNVDSMPMTVARIDESDFTMDAHDQVHLPSLPSPLDDTIVWVDVQLDAEGALSMDGEALAPDQLVDRLTALKAASAGPLAVKLGADSECPFKHLASVMNTCNIVGEIEVSIAVSPEADSPTATRGE